MSPEVIDARRLADVLAEFFDTILPRTEDLAELKVVLHVIEMTASGERIMVSREQLEKGRIARSVAGSNSAEPGISRLQRALDRAVANGSLLRLFPAGESGAETYFMPMSAGNRRLVESLGDQESHMDIGVPGQTVVVDRPNIYALYEQNIGPLTPLVAERLRDAERSYPRGWIEDAILTAVQYNKRTWRYIEAILNRWEESGTPDGIAGRRT
jgi:DNA replication protein